MTVAGDLKIRRAPVDRKAILLVVDGYGGHDVLGNRARNLNLNGTGWVG